MDCFICECGVRATYLRPSAGDESVYHQGASMTNLSIRCRIPRQPRPPLSRRGGVHCIATTSVRRRPRPTDPSSSSSSSVVVVLLLRTARAKRSPSNHWECTPPSRACSAPRLEPSDDRPWPVGNRPTEISIRPRTQRAAHPSLKRVGQSIAHAAYRIIIPFIYREEVRKWYCAVTLLSITMRKRKFSCARQNSPRREGSGHVRASGG